MRGSLLDLKKERLIEFDYLRGLAIALIVLGHSIFLSEKGFPLLLENVLRGGTGLFVFISGFFFHRVFYQGFEYRHFMGKKLRLVLVPFLAISLIGLGFRIVGWAQDGHGIDILLLNSWYTLRNGFVLYPHWYVPFILLTFACSPLHLRYIHAGLPWQIFWLLLFTLIALFIHRPDSNINQLQSLVYFTPYYLLGILYSRYSQYLLTWQMPVLILGLLLWLAAAFMQTYVDVHVGNYHKHAFVWAGIDWQLLQTLGFCLWLLVVCRYLPPGRGSQHLRLLADNSFPIFFVHPLLSILVENVIRIAVQSGWSIPHSVWPALWISALIFIFQLYGSLLVVLLLRRGWGEKSRWVIG